MLMDAFKSQCLRLLISMLFITLPALVGSPLAAQRDSRRDQITRLVVQIRRADYEGDRAALSRLYKELTPFVDDKELGTKVRYWRGFALWRRALNGLNESVALTDSEADLKLAISEFELAIAKDPAFVDARASAGSTTGMLMAMYNRNPELAPEFKDPARKQESILKALSYMNEAKAAEPRNPRVWWVLGPVEWYLAQQRGEGPLKARAAAIQTYQEGLKVARAQKISVRDPLIPAWGESELLMSLAASNLYSPVPDLVAAEQYARSALARVPYWHYVRDILLPAIEAAKFQAEIIAIERAALERRAKGDPNGYLEIMADDVMYFDSSREKRIDGLAAVKEYLVDAARRVRIDSYELINPRVKRHGDIAILTFNVLSTMKRTESDERIKDPWSSTEIYRLIGGKWKIIHSHWSYGKREMR